MSIGVFSSVQFSCSVMPDSLQPHGLQHTRPPCPSPTPRAYLNSCPLSWRCHPTISSSVVPFSHLQSFPASGSFQMSQFFASDGQSSFGKVLERPEIFLGCWRAPCTHSSAHVPVNSHTSMKDLRRLKVLISLWLWCSAQQEVKAKAEP